MDRLLLAQERLEEEKRRGLWPDRVITDYLDRWLAEKPEACALVSWREESQSAVSLTYRELAGRAVGDLAAQLGALRLPAALEYLR